MDPNAITYFAETDARNKKVRFGIKAKDRLKHVYVIGKTGMGKSTLLENMAIQDIQNGNGIAFLDPHGGTAEKLLDYVPESRIKDVVYFAPFDLDYPVSFNIMEDVGADKRHLVVAGLMATFEKIWADAWSARMAYILQNTLLALLEYPGATLLGVNRMYTDKAFRQRVVDNIKDVAVRSFWVDEYTKYTDRYTQEATPAIQNKIGQFASNPLIRNIIGQSNSTFDLRDVMDNKKILIVNLSKGLVGEGNAKLLGSMLITKIYLAAMSRADLSARDTEKAPNFYFYVDEFQSFANKSFADILSEARKYKLNLTIAHQYVEQMEEEVRDAVFGNIGTMITFRVGALDAEVLEKEFAPVFTAEDLVNLGLYQLYLKLMIDGVSSKPFSARAMPPIQKNLISYKNSVIDNSRLQFTKKRGDVENEIVAWHGQQQNQQQNQPAPQRDPGRDRESYRDNGRERGVKEEVVKKEIFNEIIKSEKPPLPKVVSDQNQNKLDENKAAFSRVAEELRLKEKMQAEMKRAQDSSVSLNQIKKEKEGKSPSKENISNLKAALSSVIAKSAQESQMKKNEPKAPTINHQPAQAGNNQYKPQSQVKQEPGPERRLELKPSPVQEVVSEVMPEIKESKLEQSQPQLAPQSPSTQTQQAPSTPPFNTQPNPKIIQEEKVTTPLDSRVHSSEPRPFENVQATIKDQTHSNFNRPHPEHKQPQIHREKDRVHKPETVQGPEDLYDISPKNEIPEDVLKRLLSVDER